MNKKIFFFVILPWLLLSQSAFACDCYTGSNDPTEVERIRFSKADIVFDGEPVSVDNVPVSEGRLLIKFKVGRVLKGVMSKEISVITGNGGGDCGLGYFFKTHRNEQHRIYAIKDNEGRFAVSICTGMIESGFNVQKAH